MSDHNSTVIYFQGEKASFKGPVLLTEGAGFQSGADPQDPNGFRLSNFLF